MDLWNTLKLTAQLDTKDNQGKITKVRQQFFCVYNFITLIFTDTVGRLTMQSKGSVDAEDFDHQPLITKRNKTVKSGPKVVTF